MSELNTKVRRRNFLKSYQEHLLKSGAHLPTNIQRTSICSGPHLHHELEDNRIHSMRKNNVSFNRNRLGGISSVQNLGEYPHHETEDNRLQSRKNTQKMRSTTTMRRNKTRRNSTQMFSRQFYREMLEGLSSVEDLEEETELSVLDCILTYDWFVLDILSETGETIGTVTVVSQEEFFL